MIVNEQDRVSDRNFGNGCGCNGRRARAAEGHLAVYFRMPIKFGHPHALHAGAPGDNFRNSGTSNIAVHQQRLTRANRCWLGAHPPFVGRSACVCRPVSSPLVTKDYRGA
jgi:hypothetical protein